MALHLPTRTINGPTGRVLRARLHGETILPGDGAYDAAHGWTRQDPRPYATGPAALRGGPGPDRVRPAPRFDADAPGHRVPVGRHPAPAGAIGGSAPVREAPAGADPSAGPAHPSPALEARLATERVAWLTTVRPDGRPHVVPIWFSWDGQAFLVYSKPHARKVENLRERPDVMLAFGDADADFDVILVEGRAELVEQPPGPPPVDHFAKYAAAMAAIDLDRDEYARTYSLAIRVTPTRFLPWGGRSHLDERRTAAGGSDGTSATAGPTI